MYAGINLDQAPPIRIPLRFLLTAPWFGFLAGLIVLLQGDTLIVSRWQPETLALVHVLVLGFVTMVMVGALFQMLPVLAGVTVKRSNGLSRLVHAGLSLGTVFLGLAFLFQFSIFYSVAALLLAFSIIALVVSMVLSLRQAPQKNANVRGMVLALSGLLITLVFALLLILIRMSLGSELVYFSVTLSQLHQFWGLVGWITILIVAVAIQVVPMFQMTPEYPDLYKRFLLPGLFVTLILTSIYLTLRALNVVGTNLSGFIILLPTVLVFVLFSAQTMRLQQQRKRRIRDAGFWFWRLGLVSLLFCAMFLLFKPWFVENSGYLGQNQWEYAVAVLFLYGFVVTVVNGMLYKIVPFLVWLHLQQGAMSKEPLYLGRIPDMKTIISDKKIWPQFWLHLAALISLLVWVFYVEVYWFSGLLVCLSFGRLGLSLHGAFRRYRLELELILKP